MQNQFKKDIKTPAVIASNGWDEKRKFEIFEVVNGKGLSTLGSSSFYFVTQIYAFYH